MRKCSCGYPPQNRTFERKTDAKRWIQQMEAAMREGRHFKHIESRKHTLCDLVDRLAHQQSSPSSYTFPSEKGQKIQKPADIRSAWEQVLKKAAIEDFRFHDLHHSANHHETVVANMNEKVFGWVQ
ncbi:MAG: hypothetical protein R3E91_04650 [Chlamydiales bacterium]